MSSDKKPSITYQNVPAVIATRGNGTTIQVLLDNDHVSNAPNALINVTGVGNASHGAVSFNAATGNVTFTPDAGFYGTRTAGHYKNRSCLRLYLLSCRPKQYLKTGKNYAKTASIKGKRGKAAQKLTNLTIKRGCSPMHICANYYENNTKLTKQSF